MKFQIGDHIAANEKSNDRFSITNQENGWTGYVVEYDRDSDMSLPLGVVSEVQYDKGMRETEFWVEEECFDLIPEEEIDIPDADLFGTLFG